MQFLTCITLVHFCPTIWIRSPLRTVSKIMHLITMMKAYDRALEFQIIVQNVVHFEVAQF